MTRPESDDWLLAKAILFKRFGTHANTDGNALPNHYRVTTLSMGALNVDSSNLYRGARAGVRVDVPVWAALIQGHGRTIIVDTGIRDPQWVQETLQNPCSQESSETLQGALWESS